MPGGFKTCRVVSRHDGWFQDMTGGFMTCRVVSRHAGWFLRVTRKNRITRSKQIPKKPIWMYFKIFQLKVKSIKMFLWHLWHLDEYKLKNENKLKFEKNWVFHFINCIHLYVKSAIKTAHKKYLKKHSNQVLKNPNPTKNRVLMYAHG